MPPKGNKNGNNGNNGNNINNNGNNYADPNGLLNFLSDDELNNIPEDQLAAMLGGEAVPEFDDLAEARKKQIQEERDLLAEVLAINSAKGEPDDSEKAREERRDKINTKKSNKRRTFKEKATAFAEWIGEGMNAAQYGALLDRINNSDEHAERFISLVKYFDADVYEPYRNEICDYFSVGILPHTSVGEMKQKRDTLDGIIADNKSLNNTKDFLLPTVAQEKDEMETANLEMFADALLWPYINIKSRYDEQYEKENLNPEYNKDVPEIDGKRIFKYKTTAFDNTLLVKNLEETTKLFLNLVGDGLSDEDYSKMIRNIRQDPRKTAIVYDFIKYGNTPFYRDFEGSFKQALRGNIDNSENPEQAEKDTEDAVDVLTEALNELRADKSLISDQPLPEEDPELNIFNEALSRVYDLNRPVFNEQMNRLYADDFSRGFDKKDAEQYAMKLNVILGFVGSHLNESQYEDMLFNIRNDKQLRKLTMDLMKENDFEGLTKHKYALKHIYSNGILSNPYNVSYAEATEKVYSFLNREDKKEIENEYEESGDKNEDLDEQYEEEIEEPAPLSQEEILAQRNRFFANMMNQQKPQNEEKQEDKKEKNGEQKEDRKEEKKEDKKEKPEEQKEDKKEKKEGKQEQKEDNKEKEEKKENKKNNKKEKEDKKEDKKEKGSKKKSGAKEDEINLLDEEGQFLFDVSEIIDTEVKNSKDKPKKGLKEENKKEKKNKKAKEDNKEEDKKDNNINNDVNQANNINEAQPDTSKDEMLALVAAENEQRDIVIAQVIEAMQTFNNGLNGGNQLSREEWKNLVNNYAKLAAYSEIPMPDVDTYGDVDALRTDLEAGRQNVELNVKHYSKDPDFSDFVHSYITQNPEMLDPESFINSWRQRANDLGQASDYSESPYLPENEDGKYSTQQVKRFCENKVREADRTPNKIFDRTEMVAAADLVIANMLKERTADKSFFANCNRAQGERKFERNELNEKIDQLRSKLLEDKNFKKVMLMRRPANRIYEDYKAALKAKMNRKIDRKEEYDRAFKRSRVSRQSREEYLDSRTVTLSFDDKQALLGLRETLNKYNEGASPSGRMERLTNALNAVLDNNGYAVNAKQMNELNRAALTYYDKRQGVIFNGPLTTSGKNRLKTVEEIIRISDKAMKPVRKEMKDSLTGPQHNNANGNHHNMGM